MKLYHSWVRGWLTQAGVGVVYLPGWKYDDGVVGSAGVWLVM